MSKPRAPEVGRRVNRKEYMRYANEFYSCDGHYFEDFMAQVREVGFSEAATHFPAVKKLKSSPSGHINGILDMGDNTVPIQPHVE